MLTLSSLPPRRSVVSNCSLLSRLLSSLRFTTRAKYSTPAKPGSKASGDFLWYGVSLALSSRLPTDTHLTHRRHTSTMRLLFPPLSLLLALGIPGDIDGFTMPQSRHNVVAAGGQNNYAFAASSSGTALRGKTNADDSAFPPSPVVVPVDQDGMSFEQLRFLIPERILLDRLDGIFVAWKQSAHEKVSVTNLAACEFIMGFDYDNERCRSEISYTQHQECTRIEIKISCDGFDPYLYLPYDEYPSHWSKDVRQPWTERARLSNDTVREHFPSIMKGVKEILNMGHEGRIYGKMHYHKVYSVERVDFLFANAEENPTFEVFVAFEPRI